MLSVNQRYYSLDVFRGATVALMILVNNPGSWNHIFPPLAHAPWHGLTPTDLVFPFFLFAVGNAMAFVMPKLQQAGPAVFWRKILKRFVLIFLIGLFLNWSPFVRWTADGLALKHWVDPKNPESGIRILGVLQRIALAYLLAGLLIFYTKPKLTLYLCMLILLGYWLLVYLAHPADPYSMLGFVGTALDANLLGVAHVYKGEGVPFDPEGLLSTLPAVVQVVFGYFAGLYIQQKGKTYNMLAHLFVGGTLLVLAALVWDAAFPINKKIWTSSYVLCTTGLALLAIGLVIYAIEFRENRGAWSRFFDVFGKNPLFIFVLSGFLPRVVGLLRWQNGVGDEGEASYTDAFHWFYEHVCAPIADDPRVGSLVYALATITFYWFLAWLLDRKKIYIKV
jgi:predicted acyltransferase